MGAVGSLVVTLSTLGNPNTTAIQGNWPFVTASSFQLRAATIKKLSGAVLIEYAPLVTRDQRDAWENYSTSSEDAKWYQEGRDYQKKLGIDDYDTRPPVEADNPEELDLLHGIANRIYDHYHVGATPCRGRISPDAGFYLPAWEASPVASRTMVNLNFATFSEAAVRCVQDADVIFEKMQV